VPDSEVRFRELVDKLRARGHRLTPQRVAVLKILSSSVGHPSVEQVYEQIEAEFPTTSLATVYKTVTLLKEMGEVLELSCNGSNRYDGNKPYPHPHLICTVCGAIQDLDSAALDEAIRHVARDSEYEIASHRLDLYGVCPSCQASRPQPRTQLRTQLRTRSAFPGAG
jgi:Fur family peroxide stress response transcriptional regulator